MDDWDKNNKIIKKFQIIIQWFHLPDNKVYIEFDNMCILRTQSMIEWIDGSWQALPVGMLIESFFPCGWIRYQPVQSLFSENGNFIQFTFQIIFVPIYIFFIQLKWKTTTSHPTAKIKSNLAKETGINRRIITRWVKKKSAILDSPYKRRNEINETKRLKTQKIRVFSLLWRFQDGSLK